MRQEALPKGVPLRPGRKVQVRDGARSVPPSKNVATRVRATPKVLAATFAGSSETV